MKLKSLNQKGTFIYTFWLKEGVFPIPDIYPYGYPGAIIPCIADGSPIYIF